MEQNISNDLWTKILVNIVENFIVNSFKKFSKLTNKLFVSQFLNKILCMNLL